MSVGTALDNIHLRGTGTWSHTEYSMGYHGAYLEKITGKTPGDDEFYRAFYDAWQIDFLWNTNDGLHGSWLEYGRATDMGHAGYALDGSDKRQPGECPFTSVEEVYAFDAVEEYGLPDIDAQVQAYERSIQDAGEKYPDQLFTGGYYKTIVSGAIQAFGWEMFLMAAADISKMEKVFESFFRRTFWFMKAWAQTSAEVMIQHDDFVWSAGAFLHPDIYRRVIIPRYAEIWRFLHESGKKVLFCSDGNFLEFAEDIVGAGSDGLIFEPCNDFGLLARRFGDCQCLVGSHVDCRDMAAGKWDAVQRSIDETFEALSTCRGAVVAVGNHIPANVPDYMLDKYIGRIKNYIGENDG